MYISTKSKLIVECNLWFITIQIIQYISQRSVFRVFDVSTTFLYEMKTRNTRQVVELKIIKLNFNQINTKQEQYIFKYLTLASHVSKRNHWKLKKKITLKFAVRIHCIANKSKLCF